jgi:hypothetical protein
MGGGIHYNTIPYITNGCIGMWDAEWNNGFNTHSPNTMIWKDLSSAGVDLSMRQGDGYFVWEDKRLHCLGKGYVASLNKMYNQFQTIECVFSINDIINDGTLSMQSLVSADNVKGVMANAYSYSSTGVCVQFGSTNASIKNAINISQSYNAFNGKIINVTGIFVSNGSNIFNTGYYNGTQKNALMCANGARADFFAVGAQSIDGRITKGYIYTIRLYNRALNAEEIEHNWLIDRNRFKITTI